MPETFGPLLHLVTELFERNLVEKLHVLEQSLEFLLRPLAEDGKQPFDAASLEALLEPGARDGIHYHGF